MSLYSKRGVSAQKEEVHAATKNLDQGIFPRAFCKIYPDLLGGDADWVNVMHADGAGTKTILAYLYWSETGDISVWKGIAQDAIVMNLDDMLCTGIYDRFLFSSTIDRNKQRIPGEVLKVLIEACQEFFDLMKKSGINIHFMGGETADVGDLVRTIAVNGTMTARWPSKKIITNENIQDGDVIVGLASYGQATYENEYNSGIASNGLTSARHDVLHKMYAVKFPETFDTILKEEVVYIGPHRLTDEVNIDHGKDYRVTVGKLLLSPTRTYAPVLKEILENHFENIHGMVHCSGGGQTKCMKYIGDGLSIEKNNLFDPPLIFQIIQNASKANDKEMYQVFNMGTRMEIYTDEKHAESFISTAKKYNIEARVIGRVYADDKKTLRISNTSGVIEY